MKQVSLVALLNFAPLLCCLLGCGGNESEPSVKKAQESLLIRHLRSLGSCGSAMIFLNENGAPRFSAEQKTGNPGPRERRGEEPWPPVLTKEQEQQRLEHEKELAAICEKYVNWLNSLSKERLKELETRYIEWFEATRSESPAPCPSLSTAPAGATARAFRNVAKPTDSGCYPLCRRTDNLLFSIRMGLISLILRPG
jgi:hypothetical protein